MIEALVYLVIVVGVAGIGVWVGIILAGRIDRRTTPSAGEPAAQPTPEESS